MVPFSELCNRRYSYLSDCFRWWLTERLGAWFHKRHLIREILYRYWCKDKLVLYRRTVITFISFSIFNFFFFPRLGPFAPLAHGRASSVHTIYMVAFPVKWHLPLNSVCTKTVRWRIWPKIGVVPHRVDGARFMWAGLHRRRSLCQPRNDMNAGRGPWCSPFLHVWKLLFYRDMNKQSNWPFLSR